MPPLELAHTVDVQRGAIQRVSFTLSAGAFTSK
jgi:hypothetical protein